MEDKKRTCPYCGEEILETAIKCKHCQSWLKKKCPFCAEMIDSNLDKCPFCDSNLIEKEVNIPKENVQTVEKNKENSKKQQTKKEETSDLGVLDAINSFFEHPFRNILIIIILLHLFGNPFSDLWTPVQEDDGTYCMKTKIFDGEKRTFCSKNEKDLIAFKNCLKSPQVKIMQMSEKSYFGDYSQATDDSFYPVCKPVSVWEKKDNEVQEQNVGNKDENEIIQTAVNEYKKEKHKEEAQRYGVSVSCYEKFRPIYMQKGDKISLEEIPCSKKEGQSIKNQLRKEEEEFNNREYALDDIEVVYGNAGMPKSLVLKGVPIICFEHANIGDNSKCTPKQLDTINKFFEENDIDWNKEYFDYLDD